MKLFAFIVLLLINGTAVADNQFSVAIDPLLPVSAGLMGGTGAGVEGEYYPSSRWTLFLGGVYSSLDPSSILQALRAPYGNSKAANASEGEEIGMGNTETYSAAVGARYFMSARQSARPQGFFVAGALLARSYRAEYYADDVTARIQEKGFAPQTSVGYRSLFRHGTFLSIAASLAYHLPLDRQERWNGDRTKLTSDGKLYLDSTTRELRWLPSIDLRAGYVL